MLTMVRALLMCGGLICMAVALWNWIRTGYHAQPGATVIQAWGNPAFCTEAGIRTRRRFWLFFLIGAAAILLSFYLASSDKYNESLFQESTEFQDTI